MDGCRYQYIRLRGVLIESLPICGGWKASFLIPPCFFQAVLVTYLLLEKTSPSQIGLPDHQEEGKEKAEQEKQMHQLVESKGMLYPHKYILSKVVSSVASSLILPIGMGLGTFAIGFVLRRECQQTLSAQ